MDIPDRLRDPTLLVKHHSVYAHLGCVALRCSIGLYFLFLFQQTLEEKVFFSLLLGSLWLFFLYKFFALKKTWKSYSRIVVTLSLCLLLIWQGELETARTGVGLLLIVDAQIGLQSRHTAKLL